MAASLLLGIDIGTASVRAGLFNRDGQRLGTGSHAISMRRPQDDFVEQSSENIWRATRSAIAQALSEAGAAPDRIAGIGFDATCSLVVLDAADRPLPVSAGANRSQASASLDTEGSGPGSEDVYNVIVWMDHRAVDQAHRINQVSHEALRYVGGRLSPEMQLPKILWLKEQCPDSYTRAARLLDLADFMTYRATGVDVRSLCTTVCKWTYLGHEGRWADDLLTTIGLGELTLDDHRIIGQRVRPMGERVGTLTSHAASELGLVPGIAVGVGIIDAHAGGLGLLGSPLDGHRPSESDLEHRLALICGTSSCHMAVSAQPRYVEGVWGPYYSAMVPGLWLTEGGQSATGALIDHVIFTHTRGEALAREAQANATTVYQLLNDVLARLAPTAPHQLTEDLHVLPYFHGNRSPRADPTLRGMLTGLKLTDSVESLATLYLATIQAIAYGTRHILTALCAEGYTIDAIFATGGDTKNDVFLREHANITGCRIALPREPEAVLLGAAMLGAVASGQSASLLEAMRSMSGTGRVVMPDAGDIAEYHRRKYNVFQRLYEDQMAYRQLMR